MRFFIRPIVVIGILLMSGCGGFSTKDEPLVDVTQEDVQTLSDIERLKSLQITLRDSLVDKSEIEYPREYELLNAVDRRIADLHTARVVKLLDAQRQSVDGAYSNVVPLPQLRQLKEQVRADKSISAPFLRQVLSPIEKEDALTRGVINPFVAQSKRSNLGAERRATIYHYLFSLSGDPELEQARDKQMDEILRAIRTASEKGVVNESLEGKVDFVLSIYPDKPIPLVDEMYEIYATLYSGRFSKNLVRGKLDAAYEVLRNLTRKANFEQIITKMQPYRQQMAEDYAVLLDASIGDKANLPQSYRWYKQAGDVRSILGLPAQTRASVEVLAQQLFNKYQSVKTAGDQALALGILYAIEEIRPGFHNLADELSLQEDAVHKSAVHRLYLKNFHSRDSVLDYGQLISTRVSQYLSEKIPHDVWLVDQDLATPLAGDGVNSKLLPDERADMMFVGNILQAKVSGSVTRSKKILKVTVGQDKLPNPDYIAWLELPLKSRTDIEKPSETIMVAKQENVAIGSTLHRKVGVFAVSYRLVDALTERTIYPDSFTLQKEFEDESNGGFELGDVVIPFKEAKLPSDAEILDQLAVEMANEIGKQLESTLENQELVYLKAAEAFAAQNNCQREVDSLAKSVMILQVKSGKSTEMRSRLSDRVLACLQ